MLTILFFGAVFCAIAQAGISLYLVSVVRKLEKEVDSLQTPF